MRILTCNLFGVLFRLLLPKWVKWGLHEIKIEREPKKSIGCRFAHASPVRLKGRRVTFGERSRLEQLRVSFGVKATSCDNAPRRYRELTSHPSKTNIPYI